MWSVEPTGHWLPDVGVRVRPMLRHDLPALAGIYRETYVAAHLVSPRRARLLAAYPHIEPPAVDEPETSWILNAGPGVRTGHVAERGDTLVGFTMPELDSRRRQPLFAKRSIAHAGNVFVSPAAQGKGVGRSLLASQLSLLASYGVQYATVRIEPGEPKQAGLIRRTRFATACTRDVLACPRGVLLDKLSRRVPAVTTGEETILPMVIRRLHTLLREKPHACYELALFDGFTQTTGVPALSSAERQAVFEHLAKSMLVRPDSVVASHDRAHLCLFANGQVFVNDDFPEDFAHAALLRYVRHVLPGNVGTVTFTISPADDYARQLLVECGFVLVGQDIDAITTLKQRRLATD